MRDINVRKDRYVVQNCDGEDAWLSLMTGEEVIETVSMLDQNPVSGLRLEVWEQTGIGELTKLCIKGPCHYDDPLLIKACREDGTIVFEGYGEEH